jgi:transcriptional regulator with XRE-family HTH domain
MTARRDPSAPSAPPPSVDGPVGAGTTAGRLVRELRERAGLTQRQLAIRAGTSTTAVSRLERGHLSPTVQTLERLLFCLGHRLDLGAEPLGLPVDGTQLDAVAGLTPDARLDLALASQASLHGLVGAARRSVAARRHGAPVRSRRR